MSKRGFVNVDAFQRETTLQEAAAQCGVSLEVTGNGRNVRIDCPFGCDGDNAGKREIAVDTENAAKQWMCHAYSCECRGNLLNLMWGFLKGRKWSGDKLRGSEFNEVKRVIAGNGPPRPREASAQGKEPAKEKPAEEKEKRNVPLRQAEHAGSRGLMNPPIWEKFEREIRGMSRAASAYVRRHPVFLLRRWKNGASAFCRWTGAATSGAGR